MKSDFNYGPITADLTSDFGQISYPALMFWIAHMKYLSFINLNIVNLWKAKTYVYQKWL